MEISKIRGKIRMDTKQWLLQNGEITNGESYQTAMFQILPNSDVTKSEQKQKIFKYIPQKDYIVDYLNRIIYHFINSNLKKTILNSKIIFLNVEHFFQLFLDT